MGQEWEFGPDKKKFIYQFFTLRKSAFMTYGQFPPKSSSNLRFFSFDKDEPHFRPFDDES